MLEPDVITNIRAIFIHNGEPVAVDEAARLLGWGVETIDQAIKWNVIQLDATSHGQPRITRAELLEQAFEQWSLADIESALTRAEWKTLVTRCGVQYDSLVVRDRDTLRSALRNDAERAAASAALLLPVRKAAAARRNARAASGPSSRTSRRFARRRRTDGVREVTLTAFEVSYRDLVPMLRIRGRWLARLGFKPGMRIYITTAPGELVMTVVDPAAAEPGTAPRPQFAVVPPLSASQEPSRVAHRAWQATVDIAGELFGNGGKVQRIVAEAWSDVGLFVLHVGCASQHIPIKKPRQRAAVVAARTLPSRRRPTR